MNPTEITTLGALKASGYTPKSIKNELRDNLLSALKSGKTVFKGIHGYEKTVIPQIERAILSKHNINLLGLRGQAKTRIARLMVGLLDEYITIVEGSEINDDPMNPISRFATELIREKGDETPISWVHRDDRFAEKLATPDVTVADIIGDVDPIKAANLKLSYADDRVIHYGMIPRANRCIFVINELPDLQARIQVALFNILQEGDIQIRGFKLRLPLDMQFLFTANPEDYTNRGSIVTPLKDRIGSQILTHYPQNIETAMTITEQEAQKVLEPYDHIHVPYLAKILLEQVSFEARNSDYVDAKSGVSARLSITAFQNLISGAEQRAIAAGEDSTAVRVSDLMSIVPSITGKVELVYEGEQEGAAKVAEILLGEAFKTIYDELFPPVRRLEKPGEEQPYHAIVNWFDEQGEFELTTDSTNSEYEAHLNQVTPLDEFVKKYHPNFDDPKDEIFVKEFVLWALAENDKLSKDHFVRTMEF